MGKKSNLTRELVEGVIARRFLLTGKPVFGIEVAHLIEDTTRVTVEKFIDEDEDTNLMSYYRPNPNTTGKRERLSKCYMPNPNLLRDTALAFQNKPHVFSIGDVGYYDADRNLLTIDGVEMSPYFLFDFVNSKGDRWCKFTRKGDTVECEATSAEHPSSLQEPAIINALKPVAGKAPRTPIQSIVEGNNKVTVVLDADGFMWRMHFDDAGSHHYHLL